MVDEETLLSDVLKEKLTKTEVFLVNAKIVPKNWTKLVNSDEYGKIETYIGPESIMGVSHDKWPMVSDMEEVVIDFELLRKMLLYFKRNGVTDAVKLYVKKDQPLFITDEKMWGMLAPRIEVDEDD